MKDRIRESDIRPDPDEAFNWLQGWYEQLDDRRVRVRGSRFKRLRLVNHSSR